MVGKLPEELRHELLTSVYGKFLEELLVRRYFPQDLIHNTVDLIY
jgi:hypothetical protein